MSATGRLTVAAVTVALAWASGQAAAVPTLPLPGPAADPDAGPTWATESVQSAAGSALTSILKRVARIRSGEAADDALPIDPAFRCEPLTPLALDVVVDRTDRSVVRADAGPRELAPGEGPGRARRAFEAFLEPFARIPGLHVKVKVYRVRIDDDGRGATVRAYVHVGGRGPGGEVEVNADWSTRWTLPDGARGTPLLAEVRVVDHEQVVARGAAARGFVDVTAAALPGEAANADGPLAIGIDTWWGHVDATTGIDALGHQGIAIADVDGDGLEDVLVTRTGGFPNRLYVRRPDGTAVDRAGAWGVDWYDLTRGALLVDLDGDGDPDLVAATLPRVRVLENVGDRFEPRAELPGTANGYSLAAADVDGDGDVDVYVTRYYATERTVGTIPTPIPYHEAENGGANVLLRNDGEWRFTDATAASGLDANNRRFSFAAAFEDHDGDGDPDLYVANDFGRNNLYRNDGGRFVDVAERAGVLDVAAGMAVTWGDPDRDGDFDLHVSNMFSSAGNRVAFLDRFQPDAPATVRERLQRHARGNSLFENAGDGNFDDVSVEAGITLGRWAWGSLFADLDNDGLEDLVVSNGYLTSDDTGDL